MKPILTVFLLLAAFSASAQTVTNLQIRAIAVLDNGTSTTNTANVSNAQALASVQFAIDKWNAERTNSVPPKAAVTNFSNFVVESARDRVIQAQQDDDADIPQKLQERIPLLSTAEKNQIRAILNAH